MTAAGKPPSTGPIRLSLTPEQVRALTDLRDWFVVKSGRARSPRHVLAWRFAAQAVAQYIRERS